MANERVLIVEDEKIVAEDLHDMLERLNYQVIGLASSGEEAIQMTEANHPDLVLMDIRLKGDMDGIEAAEAIWAQFETPVTYLTAYADESTLERAKATLPFGYILKPFEERDLRTTVEIALYKHRMETTIKKMEGWYASALDSLTDAVIATNAQGGITFMNPAAETLTGWSLRQVLGKKFNETFRISSATQPHSLSAPLEIPAASTPDRSLARPVGMLRTKDGHKHRIEYSVTPIKGDEDQITGNLVVFHQMASQRETRSAV